jgi:ribosome-binding protein aMBF1 (putative translation factor)
MNPVRCEICSKPIERGNYVHGIIVCANCALLQAEEEQLPQRKNIEGSWRSFATTKRRHRNWR